MDYFRQPIVEMDTNAIMGYVSFAISVGSLILGIINHRRIRSNCCGREAFVSLDIDKTSPLLKSVKIEETPKK